MPVHMDVCMYGSACVTLDVPRPAGKAVGGGTNSSTSAHFPKCSAASLFLLPQTLFTYIHIVMQVYALS